MEIRRFGIGHRRHEAIAGDRGVARSIIHSDHRGTITELALGRNAVLASHAAGSPAWLVVIEGGGFVTVDDETERVSAGDAVLWPAGVPHGASTGVSEMRAILVELASPDGLAGIDAFGFLVEGGDAPRKR